MSNSNVIYFFPIWMIFIITLLLVIFSIEVGYRWARHNQNRNKSEMESHVGVMVGATLGLLAFILAFTFGLAADRYDARKQKLIREVNAIGTTYLRAGLLQESDRTNVRRILNQYIDERLHWAGVEKDKVTIPSKEILDSLWANAVVVGEKAPSSEVVALFIDSVNEVIDLNTEREMARNRSHIPGVFWAMLYIVSILALAAMGYHGGEIGTRRSPVMLAVALAFSIVITAIADIDRPGEGMINVSQQAMIDLRDKVKESPY